MVRVSAGGGACDVPTVSVACAATAPAVFVAVNVYIVVAVGETVVVPEAADAVNPPGEIAIEVAPVTAQDRLAAWPAATELGAAVKEVMAGRDGPAAATVTGTVADTDPELFVAVNV